MEYITKIFIFCEKESFAFRFYRYLMLIIQRNDILLETRHRVLKLTGHSWIEFGQSICKNDSHINFFFRKINSNK